MESSVDEDAVLSDVEGEDSAPLVLGSQTTEVSKEKLQEILVELEGERLARNAAETAKSELQASFNRLKVLTHEAIKKRDEAFREKEEALRGKESLAGELAEALRLKEDALKQRDDSCRQRDETARLMEEAVKARDNSRSEIETSAQLLVNGIEKISGKISSFKSFVGGLPRSSKYSGLPAIAYGMIKRTDEIVEECLRQIDSVTKGRNEVRGQMEQRNYEIAIEVSQLEATISGLKEDLAKSRNMAGGGGGRSLEQTPTWAVAVVCFVLVLIGILMEHIIHLIGKWLTKRHKRALYEALEKIKSELMLLGFISLLLTVLQGPISEICIPKSVGDSWHPCKKSEQEHSTPTETNSEEESDSDDNIGRKLLWNPNLVTSFRRMLAGGGGDDKCAAKGKVSLVSSDGIHQLHIFIFVLAVFHVLYCISTMALGKAKMRRWKKWELETKTAEYQFSHDPDRFRFARDTSFGRRHLNFWSRSPILIWIVCFFRQFVRSVPKVDYLTLRHGFIMAHLAPQSATKFDFQKYIKRSLEEDFKVVVGISPTIWFFAVLFLLFNTHGWYSYLWLPFIPLIIILLVGTKLQVIITRMGVQIQDKGDVVKGVPVVQPADNHFWFNRPRLVLYLIHFVLFQNAFQLAFFVWAWYEFGLRSCFHEHTEDIAIRISMGVLIQFLCSYVTLPLYALVTQMGSNMKTTVFDERVATALKKWHHTAKKHLKENRRSGSVTPLSMSRPATPTHGMSPVHLLHNYRSEADSLQTSPRFYYSDNDRWDADGSASPSHHYAAGEGSSSHHNDAVEQHESVIDVQESNFPAVSHQSQHEFKRNPTDFSFAKR